jgi:hypothetical protein
MGGVGDDLEVVHELLIFSSYLTVIPAQAGIQNPGCCMDSRLRGNDGVEWAMF